jgi:hypothetical protein
MVVVVVEVVVEAVGVADNKKRWGEIKMVLGRK